MVIDGIGGATSLRSFRALRRGDPLAGDPGGRLIVMGNYNTMVQGRKSWRGWLEWYPRRGEIHPVVAERLPLSDARHAHELLESTAAKGKLVLVP